MSLRTLILNRSYSARFRGIEISRVSWGKVQAVEFLSGTDAAHDEEGETDEGRQVEANREGGKDTSRSGIDGF